MTLTERTRNVPSWSLGERLAKARKDAGLDQKEMATRLGVSSAAVAKWESDRGEPRHFMRTMDAWAEITSVDTAWLIGLVADQKQDYGRQPWDDPIYAERELALT